ncbi:MAG: DUF5334 family protein [Alphaproteobacteria bacterium]
MKFTNLKIFSIFLFFLIFQSQKTLAWGGYDFDKKTEIDIGPGNLVREGYIIEFYDSFDDNFHTGKILQMESSGSSVELTIQDLDAKKQRLFVMH